MAIDISLLCSWLQRERKRAGLTQLAAAGLAGVGYGVVTNSEQGGDILASNFLALVTAYGAEDDLAKQIKAWRTAEPAPYAPPLPASALMRVAEGTPIKSGKKKGRAR